MRKSLNEIAQNEQINFFMHFWDATKQQIITRHYNSTILGYTTASDLLKSFESGTKDLNLRKLLQLSMDGPNMSSKFF